MEYPKTIWRDRIHQIGALFLALVLVMTLAIPVAHAAVTKDQINNLKNQASSLSSQKANIEKELSKLASSKNAALDQKFLLEEKITVLRQEIAVSEETIQLLGQEIAVKEVELAEAQAEEAKYYDEFCQRVRIMEERGEISYWAVLFNANSFSDLLDRVNAISEVVDYDNMIMDELEAARIAVAEAKADLEENKKAEEETKAALTAQKADLEKQEAAVEAVINQITSQSNVYEEKLHELEDNSDALAKQIAQAEATYAAQIAAQKKAEEEARRQQLLQQQQPQPQQQQGGNSYVPPANSSSGKGFIWPVPGYRRVSSAFGWRTCPFHGKEYHSGIDVPAPSGTPIVASKAGVVIVSTYGSSYGNYVTIAHADGSRTLYAHMVSRSVSAGQTVSQGQKIGGVGTTGSSTGNHLHFEMWLNSSKSSRVNPVAYCS
ncbi:MAG: peptidoglycan DD-metalloendopeptidase family protein [Ruminiclostridium sp.]|nr:peptidoglycan DD-metalloendopeptidase family protein [Ruminiclostridium sp.]